jgi:S1-C subfamily serine protease
MRILFALIATLVVTTGALPSAAQQEAERPSATSAIEQTLVDVIARVEPSVVAVLRKPPNQPTPADVRAGDVFLDLRQQEANATPAVVASGVIIDRAGFILTQYLAVREGDEHFITTIEGKQHAVKIVAADPRSSLAMLQVVSNTTELAPQQENANAETGSFPAVRIGDAEKLQKGQFVVAIGNPFAIETDGQPTASLGIISNFARKAPPQTNFNSAPGPLKDFRTTIHHLGTLIQTDAKLGWSAGGGALVNLRGELVGLTTTAAVIAGHEQPAGYAIPMNATVRRAIETLKQGREVEYGMLGVGFGAMPFAADANSRPPLQATQVYPSSPAARAGLRIGDVITHIADRPVQDVDEVQLAISSFPPGTMATVAYKRDGRPASAQVKLAKLAVSGKVIATSREPAWRGMRVADATTLESPALANAIASGAFDQDGCVLVTEVEPDSIAWRAGVRPGMFVSHVSGKRVSTPEEFHEAVKKLDNDFDLRFTVPLSSEPKEEDTKEKED